jgi:4-hydroxy-3-methylbut-2-enyl diphosphate reductase
MSAAVLAPLRIEAWAVRGRRVGMGAREAELGDGPVVIAGLCGAVDPSLEAGDLVVASEVRGDGATIACATDLAELLGARVGTIASVRRIAGKNEKLALRDSDVLAVDMESYWLALAAAGRPVAVVRAVADRADRRVLDPRIVPAGIRGLAALRRASHVLKDWAPVESRT